MRHYSLSSVLSGHSNEVKSICVMKNGAADNFQIVSGARDGNVKTYDGHSGKYVNAVCSISDSLFASSGSDKLINVWKTGTKEPQQVLIGHDDNVTCLHSKNSIIISGSWDKTARIWRDGQCVAVLKGHDKAIWGVGIVDDMYLTASADKSIRIWNESGQCIGTAMGHEDCARSISNSDSNIYSCGNDGNVFKWAMRPDSLEPVVVGQHSAFAYCVDAKTISGAELVASCGEDLFCRVYEGPECFSLVHPKTVWSCCVLPNSDVATACADGIIRIFTTVEDRKDLALQADLDVLCQDNQMATNKGVAPNGVKYCDLPGPEELKNPGCHDGDVRYIKDPNSKQPFVYLWTVTKNEWMKMGHLVDGTSSQTHTLNGRKVDEIASVNLNDKIYQIGFDHDENPYNAAQRFIDENEFNQNFLSEIAEFIQKQQSPQSPPKEYPPDYNPDTLSNNSKRKPAAALSSPTTSKVFFPTATPFLFEDVKAAPMVKKLRQLNDELKTKGNSEAFLPSMMDEIQEVLEGCMNHNDIPTLHLDAIITSMIKWPIDTRFIVFDFIRAVLMHPDGGELIADRFAKSNDTLSVYCDALFKGALLSSADHKLVLTSLRASCNFFKNNALLKMPKRDISAGLRAVKLNVKHDKEPSRIAAASLLFNLSTIVAGNAALSPEAVEIVTLALEMLEDASYNVVFRALRTCGNMVSKQPDTARLLSQEWVVEKLTVLLEVTECNVSECVGQLIQTLTQ